MKHAPFNLLGILTGLAMGWAAMAMPMAAVFAPARVTWDATSCPAGIYNITSTAQKAGGGDWFVATTNGVQLPRPTFSQEFANLPAGRYSVSASVQGNGVAFGAKAQTIDASESGSVNTGQRGPATSAPSAGTVVQARQSAGVMQSPGTGGTASTTSSQLAIVAPTKTRSQRAIIAPEMSGQERSLWEIRRLLLEAGEVDWRRIEVVDTDGDGVIDRAAVELAGGDIYLVVIRGR